MSIKIVPSSARRSSDSAAACRRTRRERALPGVWCGTVNAMVRLGTVLLLGTMLATFAAVVEIAGGGVPPARIMTADTDATEGVTRQTIAN